MSDITYLRIPAAMQQYAELQGAVNEPGLGWHVVGEVPLVLEEFVVREPRQDRLPLMKQCPKCGGQMVLKENRKSGNIFWGCSSFPSCNGTLNTNNQGTMVFPDAWQNRRTFNHKKTTELDKEALYAVTNRAVEVFKDQNKAIEWIMTPKVSLDGLRPVDFLKNKEWLGMLITLLGDLEA